jgi:hypothetical protein
MLRPTVLVMVLVFSFVVVEAVVVMAATVEVRTEQKISDTQGGNFGDR